LHEKGLTGFGSCQAYDLKKNYFIVEYVNNTRIKRLCRVGKYQEEALSHLVEEEQGGNRAYRTATGSFPAINSSTDTSHVHIHKSMLAASSSIWQLNLRRVRKIAAAFEFYSFHLVFFL